MYVGIQLPNDIIFYFKKIDLTCKFTGIAWITKMSIFKRAQRKSVHREICEEFHHLLMKNIVHNTN